MTIEVRNEKEMKQLGANIGARLRGGEVIELVGDVGAGKTTLTKGIAAGLGVEGNVQSPSFTLSNVHNARDGIELRHYDFYRLPDAGILEHDFGESINDVRTVTVVEWAEVVSGLLPVTKITIRITPTGEMSRRLDISGPETVLDRLLSK